MVNWLEEVYKRKSFLIDDLSEWIQIESINDPTTACENKPFGQGISDAFNYILKKAQNDGFITVDDDGYACHIEYGVGSKLLGVLGHVDVVDAGENWTVEPFGGEIIDGMIYGRGTQDNKGPMMAVYYALKIIKDLDLPLKNKIRIILGGNEELEWECLNHYFKKFQQPDLGFTPDGDFPVINGEKGIITCEFSGSYEDTSVISFHAGTNRTSVCDLACACLKTNNHNIDKLFDGFLVEQNLAGNIEKKDDKYYLNIEGVAAHAASPHRGRNAAAALLSFLSLNTENEMIAYYAKVFNDTSGSGLGIKFTGNKMGELSSNLGIVKYENGIFSFIVDVRYPLEIDKDAMIKQLELVGRMAPGRHTNSEIISKRNGVYLDLEDDLIKTLRSVYEQQTGDTTTKPLIKGGDTYARIANNTVCFGMLFNTAEDRMHHKDEYILIDDLIRGTAIYAQAIYELANK